MAFPNTSLNLSAFLVNGVDLLEQLQNITIEPVNTLVDARGIADRYENNQMVKQKQTVTYEANIYNNDTSLEATNLDISLWTLDDAYVGYLKGGTLDVANAGPEVSGIAQSYEIPIPTSTSVSLKSDIMVVTEAAITALMMTASETGFAVSVAVTFAGHAVTFPGILRSSPHKVVRGEVQMENVEISLRGGTPTTAGDTTSILYLALVGAGVTSFDVDTGANEYATDTDQTAMISRLSLTFADKALIKQSVTLEVQGGMIVTEPS